MALKRNRPNVVFIVSDDQRADAIHALGNEAISTPTLDKLAQSGVVFTNAYIMGSTVGAVCIPSRAMFLTGRTLYHVPLDIGGATTFPEWLRQNGYFTFGTGKWHNQPPSFVKSFDAGKRVFFGGMHDHWRVPVRDLLPSGRFSNQYVIEKFSSELFTEAAIEFLRSYDGERPFLLYIAYTAPHDPRTPPEKFARMYDPTKIPLPKNFMPEHPFDNGELRIRDEKLAPWPRTPEVIREHIAAYYGMITHMDEQIGLLLNALRECGHAEKTIVIFASDNGLAIGSHGLLGKQNLYEHSVKVPLIVSGPDLPKGKSVDAPCYLLDLFPTICDLLGLPTPDGVEGISLLPLILGRARRTREALFFAYKDVQRAARKGRLKLIEYFVKGRKITQLFDLASDPWELNNLANSPHYRAEVSSLREELRRLQRELDDPMAGKWPL